MYFKRRVMLDPKLSNIIKAANQIATLKSHEYISIEHIIYVLMDDEEFLQKLSNLNIKDHEALKADLENLLSGFPKAVPNKNPMPTYKLNEILSEAVNKDKFDLDDFFDFILEDKDSTAYEILKFHGLQENLDDDIEYFATNLNEIASSFDPIIGREYEINTALQTLCRHKKNNPIFVGEAGVGKTAIVQGIVKKILNGNVPDKLKNSVIYSLDLVSLLAGAKYRGELEERLKFLIDKLKSNPNNILFIDEIHTILNQNGGESAVDIASVLKPYLANGTIRCIGATTYSEFRNFNKDRALLRRFAKIDVSEPSEDECFLILKGLKSTYEKFHNVTYNDEILKLSVSLAKRYLSDKFLPDSAIDIIDEAGAKASIEHKKQISKKLILEIVSKIANISNLNNTDDRTKLLKNLKNNLTSKIYGQDEAIYCINDALLCSYAGLNEKNRPIGVFLFTGSSGVGKSELARELANALNVHFERYDMSEYMEKHAVSRLIGSPPGYVGFENGGLLTNMVKKHPYSVILFDEIEKANDELLNIFLQIFDNASLTDGAGNRSDFKNTIIIMTSNLGTKEAPIMGFKKDEESKTGRAINNFFASEFRNRIDKIVYFNPLNKDILEKIITKIISKTSEEAKISIKLSSKAITELIRIGYNPEFGARNLKRVIKDKIINTLAKELLFGKLKTSKKVTIDFDKEFKFDFKGRP